MKSGSIATVAFPEHLAVVQRSHSLLRLLDAVHELQYTSSAIRMSMLEDESVPCKTEEFSS